MNIDLGAYRFAYPWVLLALLLIPALMLWRMRRGWVPIWLVPYASSWVAGGRGRIGGRRVAAVYVALALLIVACARPQRVDDRHEVMSRGYDLILAIDLSTSMLAEDYTGPNGPINRLEAIRPAILKFITGRPADRIGIVVFAGRAYTLVPLTTDHRWLARRVADLRIGFLDDGTAIGDGLGIALTHLQANRGEERAVGSFVILLTDGANNSGSLTPPQATAIARHRHVPVYTLGAGRNGMVPFPIFDDHGRRIGTRQRPSSVDEDAVRTMALETGGRYFRADETGAVASAFASIDSAEKTDFHSRTYLLTTELFAWPLVASLAGLAWAFPGLRTQKAEKLRPQIRRGVAARGQIRLSPDASSKSRLPWRFLCAFVLAVVALARPQWGPPEQSAYAPAGEVLIALDLSRSMLAADVAPSRLERARALASALVEQLPEQKIGLIGFAGAAHLLAPASDDRAPLQAFLPSVMPEHMPEQGTDFAALFDVARNAFSRSAAARCLVVFTDGEAESESWRASLALLRKDHVRVIAVGVGTAEGANVPTQEGRWLHDRSGALVQSRLSSATLSEFARETTGIYLDVGRYGELATLVRAATGVASDSANAGERHRADRFAWFLGAALLMLAWSIAHEWPAQPRMGRVMRPVTTTLLAGIGALLLACALRAQVSAPPQITDTAQELLDLHEEADPLAHVAAVVSRLIDKREPGAADYLDLARAATRYGEVHRGHAHPLSEGVLRDGLAAVERGRALEPSLAEWSTLHDKLKRLMVPPPPVTADAGPADPANDRTDARRLTAGSARAQPEAQGTKTGATDEATQKKADPQQPSSNGQGGKSAGSPNGLRPVGGSRRDVYDAAEWRDPSLVLPLHQLEQLRGTDSPPELFRLMQRPTASAVREAEHPW